MRESLRTKIQQIEKVFDIDSILNRKSADPQQIAQYYKKNRLAYRLFNSHGGFVHMGISENDQFSERDFFKQADIVEEVLRETGGTDVIELASGKATTLNYLASRNPKVKFYGIDLKDGQFRLKPRRPNVQLSYGDYHNLGQFSNATMDLAFVIEALCHSPNKNQVVKEVKRVLKPGGHFIVIDGYFSGKEMAKSDLLACKLVAKSMMVTDKEQSYQTLLKYLTKHGFKVEKSVDYSQNIMPSLWRLESKAKHLIDKPTRGKIITRIIGDKVAANAIAGYLMPACIEHGLFEYRYTLARKI